jgi:hypothetical protein
MTDTEKRIQIVAPPSEKIRSLSFTSRPEFRVLRCTKATKVRLPSLQKFFRKFLKSAEKSRLKADSCTESTRKLKDFYFAPLRRKVTILWQIRRKTGFLKKNIPLNATLWKISGRKCRDFRSLFLPKNQRTV